MVPRNLAGGPKWHPTGVTGKTNLDFASKVLSGQVPASLLGVTDHGGSIFANIANRVAQTRAIDNLLNNGVDDELNFQVLDANGKPITTPYKFGDTMRYPDKHGVVRVTNGANVKMAQEIKEYQEKKTTELMELLVLGDDVAAYVIGVSLDEWNAMCAPGGKPTGDARKWDPEMLKINCAITHIESLPTGSMSQTLCLSKLRFISKFYMNSLDGLDNFDSVAKKKAEMQSGQNNPETLSKNAGSMNVVTAAATAAAKDVRAAA